MTTTAPARTDAPTPGLRPSAHFTASSTWLNDPNGLLHHEGVYHLFFQNNPEGSDWGNISWGHATSTDLVTWTEQAVAIRSTEEEMVFSGSAVVDHRNTAGFAGPGQTALVAVYTSAYTDASPRRGTQAQSLAYSLDGGATWTRHDGNPVLDIGSGEFRDPKVFWYGGDGGHWVMVAVEATDRRVAVYTSSDLHDWTLTSRFGPAHAVGGVWECPDLFPVTVRGTAERRWVLVVSLNPGGIAGGSGTQYFVGSFDGATFTPDRLSRSADPRTFDWLDHGRDYYAAVSFSNTPDDRRLMVGWASNWDYAGATPTGPWRSAMSLVREVELVRTGDRLALTQRPVLPDDTSSLAVFDVEVPTQHGARTELVLAAEDDAVPDRVVLVVDGDRRTVSCDRRGSGQVDFHDAFPSVDVAPLPPGDATTLKVVVDASVLEVYVGGGTAVITQQIFPRAPLTRLLLAAR